MSNKPCSGDVDVSQIRVGAHLLQPHGHVTGLDKKSNRTTHFVMFADKTEDLRGHGERSRPPSSPPPPTRPLHPSSLPRARSSCHKPPVLKPSSTGQSFPSAGPGTCQRSPKSLEPAIYPKRDLSHSPVRIWPLFTHLGWGASRPPKLPPALT